MRNIILSLALIIMPPLPAYALEDGGPVFNQYELPDMFENGAGKKNPRPKPVVTVTAPTPAHKPKFDKAQYARKDMPTVVLDGTPRREDTLFVHKAIPSRAKDNPLQKQDDGRNFVGKPGAKILKSEKVVPVTAEKLEIPDDILANSLIDASVGDVLRQIDPNEKMPPPKAKRVNTNVESPELVRVKASDGYVINKTMNEKLEGTISFAYHPGISQMSGEIEDALSSQILFLGLRANVQKVEILAYASEPNIENMNARRVSLDRAIQIRDFLVAEGLPSQNIHIRALGDLTQADPNDRVDIIFEK
jgi:outer membrane protein OmpA-like peptidoglycan-associated protein